MTNTNTCIETVTTTTKRVVEGRIRGSNWGGTCALIPYDGGVMLTIRDQSYSKYDLKHLIDSLTEVHEVL